MHSPRPRPRLDLHDAARLGSLLALLALGAYLGVVLLRDLERGRLPLRDQECFRLAATHVLAGGTGYEEPARTFANPPFTLPLVAALGRLDVNQAFFALLGVSALASLLACVVLALLPAIDRRTRTTMVLVGLTCPSLLFSLHLGQPTGLYLLLVALVVLAWMKGRDGWAGLAAGLLFAKPPLALALALFGLVTRPRRFGVALLATLAALLGVSLFFGVSAWHGFFAALATLAERHEALPASWRKQLTLYAIVRTLLFDAGGALPSSVADTRLLARGLTALATLPLLAWTLRALFVARRSLLGPPLASERANEDASSTERRARATAHVASLAVLTTIASNLYLFFYDAALAIVPTLLLLAYGRGWSSPRRRHGAAALAVGLWLSMLLPMLWSGGPNPAGALALAWIVLEGRELRALASGAQEIGRNPPK